MKEKTADIDILEEDVKNILNCCTDIETLISLDKRVKEDLKNNTNNIQQHEILTIIREFIRCKNDFSNLISENKELKEKYSRKLIDFQKEREEYERDYIPKSKVEEMIKELEFKLFEDMSGRTEATYNISFTIQTLQSLLGKE